MPKAWFQPDSIWIHALLSCWRIPCTTSRKSNICRLTRFFAASRLMLAQTAGRLSSMQVCLETWTLIKGWQTSSAARIYVTFTTGRMVLPNGLSTTLFFFFPQRIFSGREPPVMTWTLPMCDISGKHLELHKCQGRQLERAKSEVQLLGRSFNDSPDFTDMCASPTCVSHCLPEGAKH